LFHVFYFIGKLICGEFEKEILSIFLSIIFILIIIDAWDKHGGEIYSGYFDYFSMGLGGVIGLNLSSLPKFSLYIFETIYITYLKLFSNNIILKEFQKQKEIKIRRQEFYQKQREYQKKIEKEEKKMSQIEDEIKRKKEQIEELQAEYPDVLPQELLPTEREILSQAIASYQGYLGELKKRFITEQVRKTIEKIEKLLKEINQLQSLGIESFKLLTEYEKEKARYNPQRIKQEVEAEWSLKDLKTQKEKEEIKLARLEIERKIKEFKVSKPKKEEKPELEKLKEKIWQEVEIEKTIKGLKDKGLSDEEIDRIEKRLYEKGVL